MVAQIEFTEWTPDGHLRHSKFVGLRNDKDACTGTNKSNYLPTIALPQN